ncbi:hypothetical protein [Bradyrhizobium sp. WBAH10]|uniref:hypothetical protein n=1 Tax=Bradyrhizobium sp. WBAH10 TaxID=1390116 RepID=UPI002AD2E4CA|nr:hypothetical protein [Bradyrhizobium sp. WBAH10]
MRSVRVSPSEPALLPARARRGVPWAQLSEQAVLPSAQARASAGPAEPLPEAGWGGAAAGGGAAGRAGAAGGAAAGGPFGGCFGFPSGPVSCGWACATTSGAASCACDAVLANCIAVRAVVASSTKRRLVMVVNFPGRFFVEVS